MLLLASGLVSVAMGQYDDAVSITVVSVGVADTRGSYRGVWHGSQTENMENH